MPKIALDEVAAMAAARAHLAARGGRSTVRQLMVALRAAGQDITLTDAVALLRKQVDLQTDDDGSVSTIASP